MKIAIVSKLWEPTSPDSVGGTGAVVGILTEELVRRGHKVTLLATGDSKTSATLISFREEPWRDDYSEGVEFLNIAEAFSAKHRFDLIDCHVEQKACFFAEATKTPTLINISYGDFSAADRQVFQRYRDLNYLSISRGLQDFLPFLNWVGNVYHGIDTNLFLFNDQPQDYLLFLARMSPQKGPHLAIEVAKKLGKKLIMAGKVIPEDKDYLERFVFPQIDNEQIVYRGVADFSEKLILFRNALALLHPIQYFEAFGLTLIESMACGTPVISFDNGAPSEIIEHQKTGFIVKDVDEMAAAVNDLHLISRAGCRQSVEHKFSHLKMVDGYEEIYQKILTR